ncbi:MAG: SlyX-like protein [Myxococcaceae bacterium]|nr:SlyX-like protein [Myxococcaceae bacterium]
MDARITELETRFTHQERQLTELSEVVWQQQQELDRLTRVVHQLQQKLAGDPGLVDAHQDEKPPHY